MIIIGKVHCSYLYNCLLAPYSNPYHRYLYYRRFHKSLNPQSPGFVAPEHYTVILVW